MTNTNDQYMFPLDRLDTYSRFISRVRARYGELSNKFVHTKFSKSDLEILFQELLVLFPLKNESLRVLRQLAVTHIAIEDCKGNLNLDDVTQQMTILAEWALEKAYKFGMESLVAKFGVPMNSLGEPSVFWIIGMGKLGANELNVSSDIDLIYVYDEMGSTRPIADKDAGSSPRENTTIVKGTSISNQDFYTKLVFEIQHYLDAVTEHGRVFRVDLALRPNGMSGPSVLCLSALEDYLQTQGREWERFAWLKSRVVAPIAHSVLPGPLLQVITPFVFRKYLDYQVFDALRVLHQQIRAQAVRFALGRPDRQSDIKLGKGGIREIEFITQLLQIVRGGQFLELRVRPTCEALIKLERSRVMSSNSVSNLTQAYIFFRNLEHRIQYLDDQQTHTIPTDPEDLKWLALSMGFENIESFLMQLNVHRELVNTEFQNLLGGKSVSEEVFNFTDSKDLEASEITDPLHKDLVARIKNLINCPRALLLSDSSRTKLNTLINRTYHWTKEASAQDLGAIRWCDWMELLLRREIYLSLLIERPTVHKNLIYILGASRWAFNYLCQHPGLIDDLSDPEILGQRFNPEQFTLSLQSRIKHQEDVDPHDDEALLNLLRRAHHSELFLCLARDLSGRLSIQEVADDLSLLAQSIIQITADVVWRRIKNIHTESPSFAVVGYGKLGGKELGYGSDLDIVFIYHDFDPQAAQIYAAFARKIIQWLSVKTTAGDLYEIDTALRPNGNSGLLVTELETFENYQLQKGSNSAWLWEQQAMTRARVVLGNDFFINRFNSVRHQVLTIKRDLSALSQEIVQMRNRLIKAYPTKAGLFNLKHSEGAMIDVEFTVQYLVLANSWKFTELTENIGNLGLIKLSCELGLIPDELGQGCIQAYTNYRKAQHAARLDERNLIFDEAIFKDDQSRVLELWNRLFS